MELKDCNSSCCEDGEYVECSESAIIQSPVAAQKQQHHHHHHGFRVRIPWLPKHMHHHHHHDKKEKCEEDALCCADKEDQPPCCSSARCETKVLTSRGKGHRYGSSVGGFDKTKGVRKSSDLCGSNCCSDVPAVSIAQPKLPGCGSSRNCCLPEEELAQEAELLHKSRIAEAGARCCSNGSCNDLASRVVHDAVLKKGSDCSSEDSCNQPKASDPLTSVSAGCCAKTNSTPKQHCHEIRKESLLNSAEPVVHSDQSSSVKKEPASGCCSKGSCKASPNKKPPSPATEVRADSDSSASSGPSAAKTVGGCCASGSCKASPNKKPPSPAIEVRADSDSSASSGPSAAKTVGGCCASGSCKASPNKKPPSPAIEVRANSDSSVFTGPNAAKAVGGCCVSGSCKAPPNKKPPSPAIEVRADSDSSVFTGPSAAKAVGGCCASGSCKASPNKKPPSPAIEVRADSDSSVFTGPSAAKAVGGCCASGSCKASPNKKSPSPAVEMREDSNSSGASTVKLVVGCGAGDCCKSSEFDAETLRGNWTIADSSAASEGRSKAVSTSTDSCCDDPSRCKSCVVTVAGEVGDCARA